MFQIEISKKEVIWNYVGTIFNMGSNYIQLPFLLCFLNPDLLGLWYVLMSLSSITNLITFGFTPSFARSIAYAWSGAQCLSKEGKTTYYDCSVKNYALLAQIISTCKLIYFAMACIATLFLLTIGYLYIGFIAKDILSPIILSSYFIFVCAVFLNLFYGFYSAFLLGVGGVTENNQAITIANVVRLIILGVLLFSGFGLLGACVAYLTYGILFRLICKAYFEKITTMTTLLKEKGIKTTKEEKIKCFKILWHNAWRDGLVFVSEYISTQAGTLVCSTFLSLEQTGCFSIVSQISVGMAKISKSVINAYLPVIQSAYVNDDIKTIKKTQSMCICGFVFIFIIGTIGMSLIGIPIIILIKKTVNLSLLLYLGLSLYHFMVSYRNCYASYLSATNRLWYWKSFIITSIACLILEVILFETTNIGVWIIVIASILSELAYNFWHWSNFVNKELNLVWNDYINGMKNYINLLVKRI